ARLLEEKARAVVAAVLLVGGDSEAERDAGAALVKIAEDLQQDSELPFHIAAARPVDAALAHERAILCSLGPRDDVQMREHHHLRALDASREDDRRRAPLHFKAPHLDRAALGVVDDKLHAALDLVGPVARARDENQVARELDEAVF